MYELRMIHVYLQMEPFIPCSSSPCKNGGTCVVNGCGPLSHYRCECDSINTGKHCEEWTGIDHVMY
jgi:hypothetical protein